ncbi:MAG: Hsp20/alpha crystallin family protein [Acidobacteriota bacterium]
MIRFDPFRDVVALQDRMNRLFSEAFPYRGREDDLLTGNWTPAVDIFEADGNLVLKAELPDMRREDIDVTVENHSLTIRGERQMNDELRKEGFHRIERAYGSFARTFSLPATVDAGKIKAEYKNGVLTLRLPLREEAKPRTINVEVAA